MQLFELTDLAIESLALLLVWSGVACLGLAAYRWRVSGLDARAIILTLAALASWAGLLRVTTGLLGGRELVPVDIVRLTLNGLPYYGVFAILIVAAVALERLARRSKAVLAGGLTLLVSLPLVGLVLATTGLDEEQLFTDRHTRAVATQPPQTPITDPAHPEMVFVPAGPFIMGSLSEHQVLPPVGNVEGDEQPVRTVYLDGFYIDRLEVTNRDFGRFVAATGHLTDRERLGFGRVWGEQGWFSEPGADWRHPLGPEDSIVELEDHPVVQVSWNDANAYCQWAGKRLPSEAEWEKAARGVDGRDYPWGTPFDPNELNYCDRDCTQLPQFKDDSASDGYARTAPVGSFPQGASPYGALDMAGNVWEWVEDWYDPDYYAYGPLRNPRGPKKRRAFELSRSIRGGSWTSEPVFARSTSRSYDPEDWGGPGAGMRCATDG